METIFQLARRLVLVMIFASFSELLLPSGKFRSFLRFAVGLAVIALMLQPLALLKGLEFVPEQLWGREASAAVDFSSQDWVRSQTKQAVEERLAEEIGQRLAADYPQCRTEVSLAVAFDQQGIIREFSGLEVDVYLAARTGAGVMPVVIGEQPAPDNKPALAAELAAGLGIDPGLLTLRVHGGEEGP